MKDMIYRQAAMETAENVAYACDEYGSSEGWLAMLINSLEILPSAQSGIIRCRDCKYADDDGVCQNSVGLVIQDDDDFCSKAERRKE